MRRASLHRRNLVLAASGLGVIAAGLWAVFERSVEPVASDPRPSAPATPAERADAGPSLRVSAEHAHYVGSDTCGECHAEVATAYRGSHHDRAMELPDEQSVSAPFAGERVRHDGVVSQFRRAGDDFVVRTPGPDGQARDYRVAYTFGVTPLQQYLLDMGDGRLQAWTVAWDARSADAGGQRFFDLYPDETLAPGDPLHWTGAMQNWNYACADCHSTALTKGYDPQQGRFETRWAELDVGCEACHGPGSFHVDWARQDRKGPSRGLVVSLQRAAAWQIPEGRRSAIPRADAANVREVETCAPCHSRRHQLREGRRPDEPWLDAYRPELLVQPLYHPDGQIDGEVYVYGSFVQSRMFHAGVRCSDCHEPHGLGLRRTGNSLCTGCHARSAYDVPAHHHHEAEQGNACVDCHMPKKTYMGVDDRRDHSLRLPRPDLGAAIGAPDACTGCHGEQSQDWAAGHIETWFGAERRPHFGRVLHAARQRAPGAGEKLAVLSRDSQAPAIVRATALSLLGDVAPTAATAGTLRDGALDGQGLVRLGAVYGARALPAPERLQLLGPLLDDPRLAVRSEAARALAELPPQAVPTSQRARLQRAVDELLETERLHADRAEAWLRIALIEQGQGSLAKAVAALEHALTLEPRFVPALVNLAELRRGQGEEARAEALLRRALEFDPESAEAWHALGLSLVRSGRVEAALAPLSRAAELRPESPRFQYVWAVANADRGELRAAVRILREALERHPHDTAMWQALAGYARQLGDTELAAQAAAQLAHEH